ncbi:MAG: ABC transporter permease [Coriobacteriales bacterium]|nr:ABC transporter permease [Coriobacteriales bacterium]
MGIETINALDANRGRSALTMLGVVIGIAAVIAMTALIGGIKKGMLGEMGASQAQLVTIELSTGDTITRSDVDMYERDLKADYEYIIATNRGDGKATTGQKKADAIIQGVEPEYFRVKGTKFAQGRGITEAENSKGAMVIVIDEGSANSLFGNAGKNVTGKTLRINNDEYTIVGVIVGGETSAKYASINVFMPFSTCATRITGSQEVGTMYGYAREGADMDAVVANTTQYLTKMYNFTSDGESGYIFVQSQKQQIDEVNTMTNSFSMLMTVVSSISLLVGGIGIMNMMLTNVTERIREIGLRKALGASRMDITMQFILESVCLCLAGGILGVFVGYAGSFALIGLGSEALFSSGMKVTPVIDMGTVLMATSICVGIGVLFGWYPARRAARLDPVESLHYQ